MTTVTHIHIGDVSGRSTEVTVDIQTGLKPGGGPVDIIKVSTFVALDRATDTVEALARRAIEQALRSIQSAGKLTVDEVHASLKQRNA